MDINGDNIGNGENVRDDDNDDVNATTVVGENSDDDKVDDGKDDCQPQKKEKNHE